MGRSGDGKQRIFKVGLRKALIFFLFLLDCGYTLERLIEAVLTSTHNLCLGAKLRKIGMPLHSPVFLYKSAV